MYWIVYYWIALNLIAVHGFSGFNCTESDIIVTEKYCNHENMTQFSMHTFTEDLLHTRNLTAATLASNGCPFEFEIDDFNNTFYIECETEINCSDDKEDIPDKRINTFVLECEDTSLFDDNSSNNVTEFIDKKSMNPTSDKIRKDDEPADTSKPIIIASSVAAGLATIAGVAAAVYHLRTIFQSGSYLFPDTPAPTGFSELV